MFLNFLVSSSSLLLDDYHALNSRYDINLKSAFFFLKLQWATAAPSTATSVPALGPSSETTSTSSVPVGSAAAVRPAPVKCNWTEHTSPDGYKYYYNYVTGESRVRY